MSVQSSFHLMFFFLTTTGLFRSSGFCCMQGAVRLSLSTVQKLHPNLRDFSSDWLNPTSLVRNKKHDLRGRNKKHPYDWMEVSRIWSIQVREISCVKDRVTTPHNQTPLSPFSPINWFKIASLEGLHKRYHTQSFQLADRRLNE